MNNKTKYILGISALVFSILLSSKNINCKTYNPENKKQEKPLIVEVTAENQTNKPVKFKVNIITSSNGMQKQRKEHQEKISPKSKKTYRYKTKECLKLNGVEVVTDENNKIENGNSKKYVGKNVLEYNPYKKRTIIIFKP